LKLDKLPTTERLLAGARITIRLAESGGRAVERKLDAAGHAAAST
jgi:hypothetical protein